MSGLRSTRRGFLAAILALGAAPAIVRAGSLMPVRLIEVADWSHPLLAGGLGRYDNATIRAQARADLAAWFGAQWDRVTLDYLRELYAPPLQFNRIGRAA